MTMSGMKPKRSMGGAMAADIMRGEWPLPHNPTVIDNDKDEITVSLDGQELRGWSYANDAERRQKMLQAREYVEGWCDGREAKR